MDGIFRSAMPDMSHYPKVFVPRVPSSLQPATSPFPYPSYSRDWGVEQDFYNFLLTYKNRVENIKDADYVYLPVFWTRIHLWNDFGKTGLEELAKSVGSIITGSKRTFSVCQYADGPLIDLGETRVFLGSRSTETGSDVPLITSGLPRPRLLGRKKYRATFAGRFDTHPIRQELWEALKNDMSVRFSAPNLTPRGFSKLMLRGEIALCPRGHGGSSFRFFEAIQLGVVPWLIGDIDVRPFKTQIDWDSCSYYSSTVGEFTDRWKTIDSQEIREKSLNVGKTGRRLDFGAWPRLLLSEL